MTGEFNLGNEGTFRGAECLQTSSLILHVDYFLSQEATRRLKKEKISHWILLKLQYNMQTVIAFFDYSSKVMIKSYKDPLLNNRYSTQEGNLKETDAKHHAQQILLITEDGEFVHPRQNNEHLWFPFSIRNSLEAKKSKERGPKHITLRTPSHC